ncbi:MAG: DNA polymerase IV, partial [Desulfobulbaceae bacterium]|nr:DNA polymerase IV [Desulfobulbaceae bacterium]
MDIIHLDMDAFYASVEVLDNPALRGRPVIVGGGFERGVVSAASYEARKFGVHSAMAMALARRRCPDGIFLPVRMARYCEISQTIHAIFHRFTPLVEPLSLDEAFLDVTGSTALFGTPPEIARRIKELVREETGLTVSAGVASCKLVAKIASDLEKPDGLTVVPPGSEQQFLAGLTIERLWGVGKCTCKELQMMGVRTMGDLTRLPEKLLTAKFGRHGPLLHQAALGIDHRRVEPFRPAQSVGNEETFSVDLISPAVIRQELLALAVKVGRRLRGDGLQGRTVTVKIKYHDFAQITRSATLAETTDDHRTIHQACCRLLEKSEA